MRAWALELARTCPSTGDATLYPGEAGLGSAATGWRASGIARQEHQAKCCAEGCHLQSSGSLGAWLLGRKPRRQVDGEKGQYGFIASRVLGQNIRKDQS